MTQPDQTALRKLIAHAIHRYDNHHALSGNDIPSEHHYGEADAVLSVLPASVDRADDRTAGVADAIRTFRFDNFGMDDVSFALEDEPEAQEWVPALTDAILATLPATTARAVELRDYWHAEAMSATTRIIELEGQLAELRRVAAETRNTTETDGGAPSIPPAHYRRDDGVDCCVHTIPVGPDSCRACRELHDDEEAAVGPTVLDEVVAALQAKAQALSVEAEEEMRRDLEDQAQVWHEAAEMARSTGRKAQRRNTTLPAGGAPQPKGA
jgi:hypothetical protein